MSRPDLVWKDGYEKPMTREGMYPYILAGAIVLLIVLLSIERVC